MNINYLDVVESALESVILSENFKRLATSGMEFLENTDQYFEVLDFARDTAAIVAAETMIAMVRIFEGDEEADRVIEQIKFEQIRMAEEHIETCDQCKEIANGTHQTH